MSMKRSPPVLAATLALSAACSAPETMPDARVDRDATTTMDAAADVAVDASAPVDTGVQTDTGVDTGVAPQCPMGQTRCGDTCANLQDDATHCGACGNACPAGQSCIAGRCGCPMGQELCSGACVDPRTSTMNCGACGNACPMGQMCVAGACRVDCPLPRTICGAGAAMECVDAANDARHCGSCNNACPTPANAASACVMGSCGLGACSAGFANCDSNAANGCEVDTRSDARSCGTCGTVCPALPNAMGACAMGMCGLGACNPGFADCDGNAANGCEVDTRRDTGNCGRCGAACAPIANGTNVCNAGVCGIAGCNAGFANCDGNAATGCEIDTRTNMANCGGCGSVCGALANGTSVCAASQCRVASCNAGFADCNGAPNDGCETNVNTSASHCGRCGMVCPGGQMCIAGACIAAPTTVTFPSAGSTLGVSPATTLGAVGTNRYYQTGDFVTETFMRTSATTQLDISFSMNDFTAGCAVGQALSWNVLVNGAVVGTFGWSGGSAVNPRTVTQSYVFAPRPAGAVTLRFQATTTVCPGGNSWVWAPGGTATLR